MSRKTFATISRHALEHNISRLRQSAPNTKILAMVKANAYGHGLSQVLSVISPKVDALGVACLEEALICRTLGVKKPVFLMEGFLHANEIPELLNHHLRSVIHHQGQIDDLKNYYKSAINASEKKLKIWIKIDTGMHRLGFSPETFLSAYNQLSQLPVTIEGTMTHFACADSDDEMTKAQCSEYLRLVDKLTTQKSLSNSAGILRYPSMHFDWIRPGLILYGVSPFDEGVAGDLGFKPVMSLFSELISIKQVPPGGGVGYGGTWRAPSAGALIGVVAVGYGDGYPWQASVNNVVTYQGRQVPLVGRVSMDMAAVDLSGFAEDEVHIGDQVLLWGEGLPVEEVARSSKTIPYDLLCKLTNRVKMSIV